jgi:hypothetical protein
MLACDPNPLPAKYFLQGPKKRKSLGARLWLLGRVLHNIQHLSALTQLIYDEWSTITSPHPCTRRHKNWVLNANPLSISGKLNIMNKVDSIPNVPHKRKWDIPLREVTDKMLRWSNGRKERVKNAVNYTNSAHICNKFSKNKKSRIFQSYPFKRLSVRFFGHFKKVSREFKYEVLFFPYNYFIYTFKLPTYIDMDSMWGHVNSDEDLFQA